MRINDITTWCGVLCLLLLAIAATAANQDKSAVQFPASIKVAEMPPEEIPSGTCENSYSGYLEIAEHGRLKNKDFTAQQIGDYVKKRLSEGYSLSLYPQISGRVFSIQTCQIKKR